MATICTHAAEIAPVPEPLDVCEQCVDEGTVWATLRQCLTCGVTLCCDSSPERHMSRHHAAVGHPIMRSVALPGEQWTWCHVDEATIRERPDGTWVAYDAFLEAGMWFAERHLAAGADPAPHRELVTPEGFPIGQWFRHVRALAAAGELDDEERAGLAAIGVAFDRG